MSKRSIHPASVVDAIPTQEPTMRELPTPTLDLSPLPDFRRSLHPRTDAPAAVVVPGAVVQAPAGIDVHIAVHHFDVMDRLADFDLPARWRFQRVAQLTVDMARAVGFGPGAVALRLGLQRRPIRSIPHHQQVHTRQTG